MNIKLLRYNQHTYHPRVFQVRFIRHQYHGELLPVFYTENLFVEFVGFVETATRSKCLGNAYFDSFFLLYLNSTYLNIPNKWPTYPVHIRNQRNFAPMKNFMLQKYTYTCMYMYYLTFFDIIL